MYHACAPDGVDLAIKVYKTSILVFKDRDRWGRFCFGFFGGGGGGMQTKRGGVRLFMHTTSHPWLVYTHV